MNDLWDDLRSRHRHRRALAQSRILTYLAEHPGQTGYEINKAIHRRPSGWNAGGTWLALDQLVDAEILERNVVGTRYEYSLLPENRA